MSLPDEFADVMAGTEAVPGPGAVLVEEAPAPAPAAAVAAEAPAVAVPLIPQPRAERVMGPVATDLPPLPRPDLPDLGPGTAAGEAREYTRPRRISGVLNGHFVCRDEAD